LVTYLSLIIGLYSFLCSKNSTYYIKTVCLIRTQGNTNIHTSTRPHQLNDTENPYKNNPPKFPSLP
jgi:hypothetical protein